MKPEHNWRFKSLDNLEKKQLESIPGDATFLVSKVISLRKIPLNEYNIEDMRIMIGQNTGLSYLIPLALEVLSENILAEGDYYEGDLFKAVITVDPGFWKNNPDLYSQMQCLIDINADVISEQGIGTEQFSKIRIS